MLTSIIKQLIEGKDISCIEMEQALHAMIEHSNEAQQAALMSLLTLKETTVDEMLGLIHAMQKMMIPLITPHRVLDIVGTGGDGYHTINISTGSALLAASCGVKIAKHGNRSVSSMSGAADVLEALGLRLDLTADEVAQQIEERNFGFCYAPNFHPNLKHLKQTRKNLGCSHSL